MKFQTLLIRFSLAVFFFASIPTMGEGIQTLEGQNYLQKRIQAQYNDILATIIDKDSFHVGVQVELEETLPEEADVSDDPENVVPGDMSIGLINTQDLLDNYEKEIKRLKAEKVSTYPTWLDRYQVASVNVMVGLRPEVGPEATAQVKKWVEDRVEADFGEVGTAQMVAFQETPKPARSKSFTERLSEFQNLLGLLLLASAIITGLLLWKLMISKDSAEQRKLAVQMQQQDLSAQQRMERARQKDAPKNPEIPIEEQRQNIALQVQKIKRLCLAIGDSVRDVFTAWAEGGEAGRMKVACLLDAIMGEEGAEELSQISLTLPQEHHDSMIETLARMGDLDYQTRRDLLGEIYWDLVASRMFGGHALDRPFGYMSGADNAAVDSLLVDQNPRTRAMVVLHMPDEAQAKYLRGMDLNAKASIISEALSLGQVSREDLQATENSLKGKMANIATGGTAKNVLNLVPRLMNAVDALEELTILSTLSQQMGDQLTSFKKIYPSLAFAGDWPPNIVSQVFEGAGPDEILTLVRAVPSIQDSVLANVSMRVQQIVRDDMAMPDNARKDDKIAHMENLRSNLFALVDQGAIDFAEVYSTNAGGAANPGQAQVDNVTNINPGQPPAGPGNQGGSNESAA